MEDQNVPNRLARSQNLHREALGQMPLGVNSNTRYWGEGRTLYVERAAGCYVWDVDGNRYLDFRLAFGAVILGYTCETVDAHVYAAMRRGVTPGLTTRQEVDVAERIIRMCPAVEKVRLVNSGSEATMHAIRLARAFTGKEKVIKFEGGYHGTHDYVLFSTYASPEAYGHPNNPIPVPASSGIPSGLRDLIITLPFNRPDLLERTLRHRGHEVAALITEPMLGNFGAIEPAPGFLQWIQAKCAEYEVVMILDEVKTGFRLARGGAQEVYGIKPDLVAYAKALGNGYPVAAYGGRRDIMDLVGRGVAQGGTYSGNGVGVAAAQATLECLETRPVLADIAVLGRQLQDGLRAIFARAAIPAVISPHPSIFSISFGVERVSDARDWARSNRAYYRRLADALLVRGVLIDEDAREPWCLSYAHTSTDLDFALSTIEEAVGAVPYA